MKIKTITACTAADFDAEVNKALAKGWELKTSAFFPGAVGGTFLGLYHAQLSLETCCDNCKHEDCDPDDPSTPCHRCEHDEMWEARGS